MIPKIVEQSIFHGVSLNTESVILLANLVIAQTDGSNNSQHHKVKRVQCMASTSVLEGATAMMVNIVMT